MALHFCSETLLLVFISVFAADLVNAQLDQNGLKLGSRVILKQDPFFVAEHLTKALTVRCSLEDALIGNSSMWTPPGSDTTYTTVGTETTQYVYTINSISFERDGQILAHLDQNSYPVAERDMSSMKVIGDLAMPLGNQDHERAFLELIWSTPSYNQSGEYTCTVNATVGLNWTMYQVSSEVGVQFPSKQDIVGQLKVLHQEDLVNQQKLAALLKTAALLKSAHAEQGEVSCGDSSGWNQYIGSRRYIYKDVKFRQPYASRSPVVFLGIKSIDSYHSRNLRMQIDVVDLNTRGFRVRCGTWGDTHIYSLSIRWSSAVA